jgi:lipoprotein-anchoring transpeptidase ErfK/SrfK
MRAGLSSHRTSLHRTMLSMAGASLLALASSAPALAQGYGFDPLQERWVRRQPARPAEAVSARREASRPEDMLASRDVQGPMMAVVSLNDQRITIYDAQGRLARAPVSSGTSGHETPVGLYTIIQKNRDHVSNLYDAEMPFMQRITWSGIALHAGVVPGYPASHGCVRLPTKFAETLFDMTNRGMRVVLVRADISPVAFAHPALFKPSLQQVAASQPAEDAPKPMHLGIPSGAAVSGFEALKAAADAKAKAAEEAGRKADAARALAYRLNSEYARDARYVRGAEYIKGNLEVQRRYAEQQLANASTPAARERAQAGVDNARRKLDEADARLQSIGASNRQQAVEQARQDAIDAEAARKKAVEDAAVAQRKLLPISVLVSRATQRIYLRQANEPVMDLPVVIKDPEKPIGTTLYTAVAHEGSEVRWTALQMYVKGTEPDVNGPANRQARRFLIKSPEPVPTSIDEAKAVLDRIEIPEEARARISEVVAPGSSLIVSDETMHKETGGGTDFIVLMPGEPQGGIRMSTKPTRERSFDDYEDDDRPRRRRRGGWDDNPWW